VLRRSGCAIGYQRAKNGSGADRNGYRVISKNGKQKLEHRHVMEKLLGRTLLHEESVHHKNGQKSDNRPDNLELWSKSQPAGQRVEDKVSWAIELLLLYAPEKLRPSMLASEHVPYDGFLSSEWLS
jgi:hypothetical protein